MPAPPANEDLPSDIRRDYDEAALIVSDSPRGAAALLRLAIQKLCVHLGESGKNINTDIAALVKKGLSEMIQQALDTVRVVGNVSVHPGRLDMRDNIDTAQQLFEPLLFVRRPAVVGVSNELGSIQEVDAGHPDQKTGVMPADGLQCGRVRVQDLDHFLRMGLLASQAPLESVRIGSGRIAEEIVGAPIRVVVGTSDDVRARRRLEAKLRNRVLPQ